MDTRKTIIIPVLAAALFAVSACGGVKERHAEVKAKIEDAKSKLRGEVHTEPVTVRVLPIAGEGATVATHTYVGTVEASKTATVSANNPGTLGQFRLKAGDKISAGQVIAKVESQTIRSSYDMAKSTLARARDGYERVSKVYSSGSVAPVKMVEVESELAQAQAAYDAAEKALWHCTVKSPISGTVAEVYATDGSEVSIAAPLVKIVDTRSGEVHFPVPESEIASIRVGDVASVEIPALGKAIQARVSSKGVVASSLSHSYDCTLALPGGDSGIMPGMVCKVSFSGSGSSATVIPANAVLTDMDGRYVWTVDPEGVVGKTYITVGGYSGTGIIVEDGLPEGLRVIVEGSRKVSTGMKVNTVE